MRGGLVETDRQTLTNLGFTDVQINYLIENNPDMMIEFVQNSINPPLDASGTPSNQFFTEAQTPQQFMADIMANNVSFDNSEGHTTAEARSIMSDLDLTNNSFDNNSTNNLNNGALDISAISEDNPLNINDLDVSVIPGSEQNTLSEESIDNSLELGGKRKSKRRTTNKRKTKKSKTRKNKKMKHRGGGFTTSEMTNPIAYKEDEYDQFKNALNYNSSKQ
jgi:hypothetical protein